MKSIIFVFFSACLLSGCIYQSVDQRDLNKAVVYCENIKNVSRISSTAFGDVTVQCFDKKSKFVDDIQGTPN